MVQVSNAKIQRFLKLYGPRICSYFPRFLVYDKHFYVFFNIMQKKIVCFLRMPNDERNDKDFQKRFGYFVASGTLDLITMWVYIFFLNAFLDIEKKYQPILG